MYWNFGGILKGPLDARFSKQAGGLVVEIGFGNGEHLAHLAKKMPDALVVGIEVSQWCITKAARRTIETGLENIRLVHGDARHLLPRMFEPSSASHIYMNFPCPWPKRRHSGRRVARPEFAELMAFCLARGGKFILATDVRWYAEETREIFDKTACFDTGDVVVNGERDYVTKYERKWRTMGRDTYTMTAVKTGPDASDACGGMADEPAWIDTPADPSGIRPKAMTLAGETIKGHGYIVIFRDVFFSDACCALITAISVDEGFEQHYRLKLTPSQSGIVCRLDSIGHPYMTPGVRASVRYAARRMAEALPGEP
ncbi:MAG: tRNA (guanosine(46)-N7)-methyltransferase TrmB [Synergistaceae bacterium]|nr:tRNA (guanosine(46)-N7)-methyltransferase TrmB [Synergistaceae bacterium]